MNRGASLVDSMLPIIGIAVLIAIWYAAIAARLVDPVLLPSPLESMRALWTGLVGGSLLYDFLRTVERTIVATAIAMVIAIPLGIGPSSTGRWNSSSTFSAPPRPRPCSRSSSSFSGWATRPRSWSPPSAPRS
jgi:ABC-type nitrate/sulfonate/bicarbonate transport system permease component